MKRLCICLCCLLLVLCACGRPAVSPLTESSSGTAERVIPQTQTDVSEFWTASQTETQTEATTEPHSEEVTTAAPTEAASSTQTTQSAATTQKPQTTRAAHTMFTSPQRTTSAHTTTAKASTTRPTAAPTTTTTTTTTTTRPTTTATTVSGGTVPSVQPVRKTCTVTIDCRELRDHPEKLKNPGKAAFVPKNGYIVKDVTAEFKDGESVYDVLRRVCATHTCTDNCRYCAAEGIQMESTYTPQFDSYYVEGIHQLYEKDCGGTSGWTYWVNGVFPNYGCSDYIVKPGDRIVWVYSIELDENETF